MAPLIVRPVQGVPLLKSAVEVNRRLQLPDGDLEAMNEAKDAVQYCVRRALLAEFLDLWQDTEFTQEPRATEGSQLKDLFGFHWNFPETIEDNTR
ncbi:Cytochrome b5 [Durusdinium trenchii]|uniref:Cytochrome b5 n=1 Tax=Durusdinium trenchii TaxID=1381693 RepID=A0ABP0IM74_9DINO